MTSRFILPRLCMILKNYKSSAPILNHLFLRQSSYQTSKLVGDIEEYAKFEVTKSPEEWKYVERLLPKLVIPEPVKKTEYPSNWKPPKETLSDLKYYIPRNRNYMLPVYLEITHRGMRKLTVIRRIQGDIFELSNELKDYLEKKTQRHVAMQVNEFVGYIHVKGDHVLSVKDYLFEKGL